MTQKVLIAGGTGLIGSRLTQILLKDGYTTGILTRQAKQSSEENLIYYQWDPDNQEIDPEALQNTKHVINLSGRNIGEKRWNESFKKDLLKSRVVATKFLINSIKKQNAGVDTFVNASAINYYGSERNDTVSEESGSGNEFLSRLCREWEREAERAKEINIRTVIIRNGIVLARQGALQQIALPIKLWVGAPLSPGNQHMSWIHIDDICGIIKHALENKEVAGIYNGVAPAPVTNRELTNSIGKLLKKPLFLPPVPGFVLRMMLGEFARYLRGNLAVSSRKIEKTGYKFQYPEHEKALEDLLLTQ